MHDAVVARGASIPARQRLLRRDESARHESAVELKPMRASKHALDPHGLMNPGKLPA